MNGISIVDTLPQIAILGVEVQGFIATIGVFIAIFLFLWLISRFLLFRLKKIAEKTHHLTDDVIIDALLEVKWPAYFFISLYAAISTVTVPQFLLNFVRIATLATTLFYVVRVLQKLLVHFTNRYIRRQPEAQKQDPSIILFASRFASYTLWLLAFLVVFENAGFDINALIAGLGVAGIAIALAVQNILGDMLSSL